MTGRDGNRRAGRGDALRRYPPLAGAVVAMLLAVFVLPSALNVPQTPPQQTLEFAPVPPTDEDPPPPDSGNVSGLGLGSSPTGPSTSTVGGGGGPPPPPPPPPAPPGGAGDRPITKRCVGSPPRQTEDPMSPPCVGFFDGDNGGATAPGVTGNEVVILVYIQGQAVSAGAACADDGCDIDEFYDLGKPPEESNENGHDEVEAYWPHVFRVWQRYFNERFQLYGRTAHLWVHFGSLENSPEARIANVAEAADRLDPFAVIADVAINGEVYGQEWASRGKTVFMTKTSQFDEVGYDESFFQTHPGQLWDFQPSVQEMAENYSSFLCAQVVGHPVSFSGDGNIGDPRKFGMIVAGHPNFQNRIDYAALIQEELEECGAGPIHVETDTASGEAEPTQNSQADKLARMARMRDAEVTTIIDTQFYLGYTRTVGLLQPPWRPEWVANKDNVVGIRTLEDPAVFQHTRNHTNKPRAASGADRPCERAWNDVAPGDRDATGGSFGQSGIVCISYNTARMLFTGIQVAGPRLTNESLDKGMHAIPAIPTGDPRVPACFYRPGDYTCVKDAQVQWWDPGGTTDRNSDPGCWVSIDGGARYLTNTWPVQDVEVARKPSDTCNVTY